MDIEGFFEECDEDDLAELLEDDERAINPVEVVEAEDSEDQDESESEDDSTYQKKAKPNCPYTKRKPDVIVSKLSVLFL